VVATRLDQLFGGLLAELRQIGCLFRLVSLQFLFELAYAIPCELHLLLNLQPLALGVEVVDLRAELFVHQEDPHRLEICCNAEANFERCAVGVLGCHSRFDPPNLLIVGSQLGLVLLDPSGPDRRLKTRVVVAGFRLVGCVVEFAFEPLDLRDEALDLASQLVCIGFTEGRVERRQDLALADNVADPRIEAAHHRRLERLHDNCRRGRHKFTRCDHNAVNLGDRRPGARNHDNRDQGI
jgi:hypothetical protein